MTQPLAPFAITRPIAPRLEAVLTYWQKLRRGSAETPFADDLGLPDIRRLDAQIFLLDVFERPERFRLSLAELDLAPADQDRLLGKFIDEVDLPNPFDLLRAQASATVETRHPTLYRHEPATLTDQGYDRLMLPTWGAGQVQLLLGAVVPR